MAGRALAVRLVNCLTVNVSAALGVPLISPVGRILVNICHFCLLVLEENLDVGLAFDTLVEFITGKERIDVLKGIRAERAAEIELIAGLAESVSVNDLINRAVSGLIDGIFRGIEKAVKVFASL